MPPPILNQRPLHILIVEDNAFLRKILCDTLQATHHIYSASSLKEGWHVYLSKLPQIVFLDINLPDGSGHTLAHKIKEADPSAFIVMATASDYAEDKQEATKNHVDGFIVKPYDKQAIVQCIDRYLALQTPL